MKALGATSIGSFKSVEKDWRSRRLIKNKFQTLGTTSETQLGRTLPCKQTRLLCFRPMRRGRPTEPNGLRLAFRVSFLLPQEEGNRSYSSLAGGVSEEGQGCLHDDDDDYVMIGLLVRWASIIIIIIISGRNYVWTHAHEYPFGFGWGSCLGLALLSIRPVGRWYDDMLIR